MRVATELQEALGTLLQAAPSDSPVLQHLIDSYRDIARELGQQHDVEHVLHDLLAAADTAPDPSCTPCQAPRRAAPIQTSGQASSTT